MKSILLSFTRRRLLAGAGFTAALLFSLLIGGPGAAGGLRAETDREPPLDLSIRKSVVLVRITPIFYNYAIPWVKQPGQSYTVVGLVMPGKKILVLANDIRDAALLEVTRYSSYERSLAKVDLLDIEANLALLSVEDESFFDNLLPEDAARAQLTATLPVDASDAWSLLAHYGAESAGALTLLPPNTGQLAGGLQPTLL